MPRKKLKQKKKQNKYMHFSVIFLYELFSALFNA